MSSRIFFHDHCFDGACSASLFTRFHEALGGPRTDYSYQGLVHRAGSLYDEAWFEQADENAIVDFKYSPSPRVTWWFDHHQSAFASEAEHAQFERGQRHADGTPGPRAKRDFFDPKFVSCTGWIAHVAANVFGMDMARYAELIHWANIVDGAKYESAEAAVAMREPAMLLTMAIEGSPSSTLIPQMIPLLTSEPLADVLAQPFVQVEIGPLLERHRAAIELIGERAHLERGVLSFDITDEPTEGYNKFIPYFLFPDATYNVGLSKSSFRTKVSVGTNPWTKKPADELANIAAICERFGGGGHARVGAISFAVDKEDDARMAAAQIIRELRDREP